MTAAQRDTFARLGLDPWQARWDDAEIAEIDGKRIHPNGDVEFADPQADTRGGSDG